MSAPDTSGTFDIAIDQSSDFSFIFTVLDEDDAPVDLTGESYVGQVRPNFNDTTEIFEMDIQLLAQTGPTLGQVSVKIPFAQTDAFIMAATVKKIDYVYDIFRTFADAHVEKLLKGKATIYARVTKE